jgi:HSP20 family protein
MNTNETVAKRETATPQVEPTHCGRSYIPTVDIIEAKQELLLVADVPGAKAGDIDIDYERGRLTIQARVQARQPEDRTQYLLHEYGVGDFCRSFEVGEGIDSEKIHAEVADGVLTLHLPKAAELQPRRIAVTATK